MMWMDFFVWHPLTLALSPRGRGDDLICGKRSILSFPLLPLGRRCPPIDKLRRADEGARREATSIILPAGTKVGRV